MDKLKLFLISCLIFVCSCSPRPYQIYSYTKQFSKEQIDSIYEAENLSKDTWIETILVDEETGDTLISKAFYLKIDNDSVRGIRYVHREVNGVHTFAKQVIKKNK